MTTFIPLGYHCNISFLTQDLNIKRETGLFEWLESKSLQSITNIINIIKVGINTSIIKGVDKNIVVLDKNVFTYHYNINEYRRIFVRRATRFLDLLKQSAELIFVRINPIGASTTAKEIRNFSEAIHSINPNLSIKFLLIDTVNGSLGKNISIDNITLLHRTFNYNDCKDNKYLQNNKDIQQQFLAYMIEAGYIANTLESKCFTDKN